MTDQMIKPQVNAEAEFLEILNDFGNPLEILREAISNSIDAKATELYVDFSVVEVDGAKKLLIELRDNGTGMKEEVLRRDFWGLGYSPSRLRDDAIGEKGHGTKIYLRSERVEVRTQCAGAAFSSVCDRPLANLSKGVLHAPTIEKIDPFREGTGTEIRIIGYNDSERSRFVQDIVRDYILWFTKVGSVERIFGIEKLADFKVFLKCIGETEYQKIDFGHVFPPESEPIAELFEKRGSEAADWYVRRFVYSNKQLPNYPEVKFDLVISVEGDEVKREYNKMIGDRRSKDKGKYRVGDRYGLWLTKDYIPVERKLEWISGFGSGSNAYVLLHAFVNCQELRLTANRGTVANTDPKIFAELQQEVAKYIALVDVELNNNGVYTLRSWQDEERTIKGEQAEFSRRAKDIKSRKIAKLDKRTLLEPRNESELFGLFMSVYSMQPNLFDFEPLDYNTTRGIDVIARNKTENTITESEYWYIEMKFHLSPKFNHAFKFLRYIVCWDFHTSVNSNTEFKGVEEGDVRKLRTHTDENGITIYFLEHPKKQGRIEVIRLKEFLSQKLKLEFKQQ
jgi:hypothetical protein